MPEESAARQFITAAFGAWQRAGNPFVVLRNYENLPQATANDIDVLVEPDQRRQAEQVLIRTAGECGYKLHLRAEYATLALYFSAVESRSQIHFDLFAGFTWRGIPFLDSEPFLQSKIQRASFFVPHPAHESACNLLSSLVYTGKLKGKYQASISAGFSNHPETARTLLGKTYGSILAKRIVDAAIAGRWAEIESLAGVVRATAVRRRLASRPFCTLTAAASDASRVVHRYFHPPGRAVVLCGPDGCGKSTVGPSVVDGLARTFSPDKGTQFHWKPAIFSARRQATRGPSTTPHSKPPRNALISLVYFKIHWLEFFLGWHLRVRPKLFRGGLVLIDRWYYDFFVDQRRYRLRVPNLMVRLGLAVLPKPDLVFLLDAPPEVLRQRKQEVPEVETRRQREAYLNLVQTLPNGVVVDASQPPDRVAGDICRKILERMAAQIAEP
jgi:thymidylate kinase